MRFSVAETAAVAVVSVDVKRRRRTVARAGVLKETWRERAPIGGGVFIVMHGRNRDPFETSGEKK